MSQDDVEGDLRPEPLPPLNSAKRRAPDPVATALPVPTLEPTATPPEKAPDA